MKERLVKVLKTGLLIICIGIIYGIWCINTGLAVPCFFHRITGLYCPGCGVTRLCTSLLKLDFHEAFSANPFIFTMLPIWLGYATVKLVLYIKRGIFSTYGKIDKIIIYASLVLAILFGILRNVDSISDMLRFR